MGSLGGPSTGHIGNLITSACELFKEIFFLRDLCAKCVVWDQPLPMEKVGMMVKLFIKYLEQLRIPCCYFSMSLSVMLHRKLHTFCDASQKAFAAVANIKA